MGAGGLIEKGGGGGVAARGERELCRLIETDGPREGGHRKRSPNMALQA